MGRWTAPSWWDRLGGPNALTRAAWLLALPASVGITFSLVPRGLAGTELAWLGLAFAAHLVTGLVLLAARATVLPAGPRPSRPWLVVGTLALAGMARGAFLSGATVALGLADASMMSTRILGGAVSVVIWMTLAILIVDTGIRHRETMARLQAEIAREAELAEAAAEVGRELRASVVEETEQAVSAQLEKVVGLAADPAGASQRLMEIVDEVVRPLSHELQRRAVDEERLLRGAWAVLRPGPVPLRAYLAGAVTARPFSPWLSAVLVAATPLPMDIGWYGPTAGVAILVASGLLVGGTLLLCERALLPVIGRMGSAARAVAVVLAWLGVSVADGLLLANTVGYLRADLASATPVGLFTVGFGLTVAATVVPAILESVWALRRDAEQRLGEAVVAAEWAAARLRQHAWNEQRRLGRAIHGELQARIVSLALQIQLNPPADSSAAIAGLAGEVREMLAERPEDSCSEALRRLDELWRDSIHLSMDVDPSCARALDRDGIAGTALAEVVREAVTNAVRHGGADEVSVRVRPGAGCVEVTVTDDGSGVVASSQAGLGSRVLDAACVEWSLAPGVTSVLTARIVCEGMRRMEGVAA